MESSTVLVVDDERKIRELLRLYLEQEGYIVLQAESGSQALETLERARPDLLVLDLMLPDVPGEEVARSLRSRSDIPIIMLTAKASEDDRINGFRLGADDYVTKPFSPRELVVRVGAVLRRWRDANSPENTSFDQGRLMIGRASREVLLDGSPVDLSHSEFDILLALTSHPGHVVTRPDLIAAKERGCRSEGGERTIDTHIKNLRRKLGDDPRNPRYVVTVNRFGYKFGVGRDTPSNRAVTSSVPAARPGIGW
jgi:two-component system, OmpR family, response regulator RegX3